MPPKKKGRVPPGPAPTLSADVAERLVEDLPPPAEANIRDDNTVPDPWTDEQETSLYKAMIRWKPVGMHKHFRMIAISEHLKNHGYNGYATPQNAHTKIPGIWEKLGTLYNLEVLDVREDNMDSIPCYEFSLPHDEYWSMKFAKRLASDGPSSPPSLPHQLSNPFVDGGRHLRRHSTVDDTDEPRSSPASTRGTPSGRGTRALKGTRRSKLAEVSTPGGRRATKTQVHQETEDEDEEEEEENDNTMEEDEDDTKAATTRGKGRAAVVKNSTRRSGRKKRTN